MLTLAVVLGAVPLGGCASLFGGRAEDEGPRPAREAAPRPGWQGSRPGLPTDWPIQDEPAEPAIKQVRFPEGPREPPPEPVKAEAPKSSPKPAEPPAEMPALEIHPRPEEPLLAAMRCYLEKHPAEALDHLKGYDRANQEALLLLLPLAARLSECSLDQVGPQEMAALADQQHALATLLQRRVPLRIDRMCFCRTINGFGRYEPLPEGEAAFQAGSPSQAGELVEVYAEVSNFTSRAEGPYCVTRLASWGEILDYEGKKVCSLDFKTKTDTSRSPRQDYLISYSFGVPPDLPPGHYTLWIYVKDELAQSSRPPARRSLDFRVIASGAARGSRGEPGLASSK
jgi:hypothetical protein